MKLRECDCAKDCYGQSVGFIASGKPSVQKMYEELWNHPDGCGYKFAIVMDCSTDEYVPPDSETFIYYLGDILPEVVDWCGTDDVLNHIGLDKVVNWLEKKGVKVK